MRGIVDPVQGEDEYANKEPEGISDDGGQRNGIVSSDDEEDLNDRIRQYDNLVKVNEVLTQFEKCYYTSKKSFGAMTIDNQESYLTSQVIAQCYKVVKDQFYDENPNFDSEQMDSKIQECI